MEKKPRIYKKSSNPPVFDSIKGILFYHGKILTEQEKIRLKGECITFKGTMLYQLLANRMADEMQREIVENHTEATPNGKDERTTDFYRAILADRRMVIEEIDNWANYESKVPITATQPVNHVNGILQ